MKLHVKISLVAVLVFLTFCSNERQIDKKELAEVYVDLQLSQELYSYNPDTLDIKQDSILQSYNISRHDFNEAIKNIPTESAEWDTFFNHAQAYLDTLRNRNLN